MANDVTNTNAGVTMNSYTLNLESIEGSSDCRLYRLLHVDCGNMAPTCRKRPTRPPSTECKGCYLNQNMWIYFNKTCGLQRLSLASSQVWRCHSSCPPHLQTVAQSVYCPDNTMSITMIRVWILSLSLHIRLALHSLKNCFRSA